MKAMYVPSIVLDAFAYIAFFFPSFFLFFFLVFWFLFFFAFYGHTHAYGISQARGQIRATAAGLCHNHSNAGSELGL